MSIFFQTLLKTLGFTAAIILIIIFIVILLKFNDNQTNFYFKNTEKENNSSQTIAVMNLEGPIISKPKKNYDLKIFNNLNVIYPLLIEDYLSELETNDLKGLIISINSPGGSVSATKEIYSLIKNFKVKNNIPIYFHTSDILASGGYWISISGDKIFANYGAIIGSIGVKGPNWLYYNSPTSISSGFLGNSVESPNGIKLFSNTAGIYKDIFNPFRRPTNTEMLELQQMVDDIYYDLVSLVSSNRKIEKEIIIKEIGAMIYNSQRAKENYLIDAEKNIKEVIEIMSQKLKLNNIKIISNHSKNYNLMMLKNFILLNNDQTINDYKLSIKEKFCNNFQNEFSSISSSISNYKC